MKPEVVVIDDSITVRMDLKEALEAAGFSTVLCATLAEARQALATDSRALVILDVLLPDGDGVAFLREIRASASTSALPVIFLSAEAEVKDRLRGLSTGAAEYVAKPYSRPFLVARVRELVGKGEATALGQPKAPSVLVIDDSLSARETLRERLTASGYRVLLAESGEEGLALAVEAKPAAIIVDGHLPGIAGTTVIQRIRADATLRSTPCLLLTASSRSRDDESAALDSGADTYVRKDEDPEILLARLSAIMRSPAAPPPSEVEGSFLKPKRILAVDDSATYLHQLSEVLRAEGYDVVTAKSGEESLELLRVQAVDCVLLDLIMPGLSGQECCRKIKDSVDWREIPVLLLTARDDREAMLEGFNAGADDYISKSSEFSVLKARLRAQIRRKQFEQENRAIREELLRKKAEAAEARANRELAETRARLLADLERTNRELESFSYSVSHDLRAPLRAMIGFGEILLEDHGKSLNKEGQGYLMRVIEAAKRMGRLIDGLLSLSRLTRKDLRVESVSLTKIAHSLISDLRSADPDRAVEVVIADGLSAEGDSSLLQAAIQNLLGNAWKFTSKRRDARIEFGATGGADGTAFFVRDNGAGFDMQYADKLFGAFQRLHTENQFEGTGIGLATVQRIIHRHGGRIWAESEPGQGTTFYFTLGRTRGGNDQKNHSSRRG